MTRSQAKVQNAPLNPPQAPQTPAKIIVGQRQRSVAHLTKRRRLGDIETEEMNISKQPTQIILRDRIQQKKPSAVVSKIENSAKRPTELIIESSSGLKLARNSKFDLTQDGVKSKQSDGERTKRLMSSQNNCEKTSPPPTQKAVDMRKSPVFSEGTRRDECKTLVVVLRYKVPSERVAGSIKGKVACPVNTTPRKATAVSPRKQPVAEGAASGPSSNTRAKVLLPCTRKDTILLGPSASANKRKNKVSTSLGISRTSNRLRSSKKTDVITQPENAEAMLF